MSSYTTIGSILSLRSIFTFNLSYRSLISGMSSNSSVNIGSTLSFAIDLNISRASSYKQTWNILIYKTIIDKIDEYSYMCTRVQACLLTVTGATYIKQLREKLTLRKVFGTKFWQNQRIVQILVIMVGCRSNSIFTSI